jgi:Gluconate 2-dehydrogenase subunit 3
VRQEQDLDFFTPAQHAVIEAACERLIPAAPGHPGARALGVADYLDGMLGAFAVDPPRIFAGGPFSGRFGGDAGFGDFLALSRLEELAWRIRIEGSLGMPEREFNGPVVGWQQRYRDGLAALGDDFCALDGEGQDARLETVPDFKRLLYRHACEGAYAAPEYGGNRGSNGWTAVGYLGDVQPRGYTDEEVSGRE